jgi:hypothetical protein
MASDYRYPKMVREALCAAQSALAERARGGMDVDQVPHWIGHLGALINQIDEHRPVGSNGKHGEKHTSTCGCDDHTGAWAIWFSAKPAPRIEVCHACARGDCHDCTSSDESPCGCPIRTGGL